MNSRRTLIKRLFAFALILMLAVANGVPAIAQTADEGTYTITIKNNSGMPGMTTGQFVAYQIFAGRVDKNENGERTLADVTWGNGVNEVALVEALKGADTLGGAFASINSLTENSTDREKNASAREVSYVMENSTDKLFLQAFAKIVKANVNNNAISSEVTADGTSVIDVSENGAGYYLVVDTTDTAEQVVSSFILDVIGTQEINIKASIPTVNKEIVNANNGNDRAKTDSVGIGDTVDFEIIGTLAVNYEDFTEYNYKFVDTMGKGLTLPDWTDPEIDVFTVTINNYSVGEDGVKDLVGSYEIILNELSDSESDTEKAPYYTVTDGKDETIDTEIVVDLGDLKQLTVDNCFAGEGDMTITKDSEIVLNYSAVVNSNAAVGNPGNYNSVYLSYSNNPNVTASMINTAADGVILYTYELDLTKVAEQNNAIKLSGAEFSLSRDGENGTEYYKVTDNGDVKWVSSNGTVLTTDVNGHFENKVIGLDAGVTYTLTEEKAPHGYNKIDPFSVTINAEVDKTGITALSVNNDDIKDNELVVDLTNAPDVNSVAVGTVMLQVSDPKIPFLPFTGGMGTTVFYVLGGALILAATLFAVKKSKEKN